MHAGRPRTQKGLLGDLAVRPADRDEAYDLGLTPGQATTSEPRERSPTRPRVDLLAECGDFSGESIHEGPGLQPPGGPVSRHQPFHRLVLPSAERQGVCNPSL